MYVYVWKCACVHVCVWREERKNRERKRKHGKILKVIEFVKMINSLIWERNQADLRVLQSNSQCQKIMVLTGSSRKINVLLKDFISRQIIFQLQRLQTVLNMKEFREYSFHETFLKEANTNYRESWTWKNSGNIHSMNIFLKKLPKIECQPTKR